MTVRMKKMTREMMRVKSLSKVYLAIQSNMVGNHGAGLRPNYYGQNKAFSSKWTILGENFLDGLYYPWKVLFNKTVPVKSYPILSFCVIMIYCFLITRYTIFTVGTIISWFSVTPTFVGLTMMSWGGNIGGNIAYILHNK